MPATGEPVTAFRQRVRSLWESEQFAELEKIAEQSRAGKPRCSDGYWQIAHFYDVLRRRDDPQTRDMWLEMLDRAQRWEKASPRSVTAKVVLAGCWNGYAWYSRGPRNDGKPVDADAQALFLERLGKARAILEEAQRLPVVDPHLLHIMQYIARGEAWPRARYEELFRKAMQLEPTYHSYYYEKTTYLLPKWYGQPGDLAKFAAEAADAVGGEEGDVIYKTVAVGAYFGTIVEHATKSEAFFQEQGFSWPRTRSGFESFDKRHPDSAINLNCFAELACIARDKPTTRALTDRLGPFYLRGYWPSEGLFQECRDWSHSDREERKDWLELLRSLLPGE